jgi:hypothetical protein
MADEGIHLSKFKGNLAEPGALSVAIASTISPLALDLSYKVLVDATGEGFVTSDYPVAACNPLLSFRRFGSNCGIASKGLQLYFPLDSRKLIMFYDGAAYSVGRKREIVVDVSDPSDVHALNVLQMCAASENIYHLGEHLDVAALHRKSAPYFRTRKARFRVLEQKHSGPSRGSEILASSREDIRTNLSLSFVSVRTAMKRWREKARRERLQPAAEVRNPELLAAFREFEEELRSGRAQGSDFIQTMVEAYARRSKGESDEG